MKDRNWNKEFEYNWKWLALGLFFIFAAIFGDAQANNYKNANYTFPSERAEFHLIRNDGMNTHLTWKCQDVETCYEVFKMKQHKDNTQNCANGMWIERPNGYKWRLK